MTFCVLVIGAILTHVPIPDAPPKSARLRDQLRFQFLMEEFKRLPTPGELEQEIRDKRLAMTKSTLASVQESMKVLVQRGRNNENDDVYKLLTKYEAKLKREIAELEARQPAAPTIIPR